VGYISFWALIAESSLSSASDAKTVLIHVISLTLPQIVIALSSLLATPARAPAKKEIIDRSAERDDSNSEKRLLRVITPEQNEQHYDER
jgi:hypothetical protein